MKFSAQREALLKPLQQVVGVVERRQTLPVLANLLVVADDNGIGFTGTDLEVEMAARMALKPEAPGETTIPARKLVDIVRALPDGSSIEIGVGENQVNVRSGRSRFTLATLPATDFPVVEDVGAVHSVELEAKGLREIIERTHFAMAHQDVRYYLNGLLLELSDGLVRAVATDAHRLALCDFKADLSVTEDVQVIVPRKGIHELLRLLADVEDVVRVEVGKNHIRVSFDSTVFTSKLIDGRFPDYQAVIPAGPDKILDTDRGSLREALQRAAILSSEKYKGVRLEIAPGRLRIVAHNPEQEEAVEEVEVSYDAEELSVGFNVTYLLDALGALDGETVQLCLVDENSGTLLVEPGNDRCRHVVMPLRL